MRVSPVSIVCVPPGWVAAGGTPYFATEMLVASKSLGEGSTTFVIFTTVIVLKKIDSTNHIGPPEDDPCITVGVKVKLLEPLRSTRREANVLTSESITVD